MNVTSPKFSGTTIFDNRLFQQKVTEDEQARVFNSKAHQTDRTEFDVATKTCHLDPQQFGIAVNYNNEQGLKNDECLRACLTEQGIPFKAFDFWWPVPFLVDILGCMDGRLEGPQQLKELAEGMLALDKYAGRDHYAERTAAELGGAEYQLPE